jgi:steroid delta-isomerase-like uncharacterized protein
MRKQIWIAFLGAMILALPGFAAESTIEQNKDVARRVMEEMLGQGKFELAEQLYSKDFVNHGLTRDIGFEEDQAAARGWREAFPDLKTTVDMLTAEGDLVTVMWTARGTNTGSGNGLPATGKSGQVRGITIWRVRNGKITDEWSAFDQLSILKQLGLLPAQ